jgi:hypothetical protein
MAKKLIRPIRSEADYDAALDEIEAQRGARARPNFHHRALPHRLAAERQSYRPSDMEARPAGGDVRPRQY